MSTVVVSSNGRIALPAELRRRLGLGVGARLEVSEEPDGLRLRILHPQSADDLAALAGIVRAPSRGAPRSLDDFDPASLLARGQGQAG